VQRPPNGILMPVRRNGNLALNTPILGAEEERNRSNWVNISLRENRSRLQSGWPLRRGVISFALSMSYANSRGGNRFAQFNFRRRTRCPADASRTHGSRGPCIVDRRRWKVTSFTSKVVDGGRNKASLRNAAGRLRHIHTGLACSANTGRR
jgi:hypothetical protein